MNRSTNVNPLKKIVRQSDLNEIIKVTVPHEHALPIEATEDLKSHFLEQLKINECILRRGISRPRSHVHWDFVPQEFQNRQLITYGTPGEKNGYNGLNANYTESKLIDKLRILFGDENGEITGYITPGGSLSNLQAVYTAKRNYRENAAFILTKTTHFSCDKSLDIIDFGDVRRVNSNEDESMCLKSLEKVLNECNKDGIQAVNVILTAGTTIKGAHDNIRSVLRLLDDSGYTSENRFVHIDGALTGMYLNLLKEGDFVGESDELKLSDITPNFLLAIDSLSVSTHKFTGTRTSGSIFLCRTNKFKPRGRVSYVNIDDGTIPGSRAAEPSLQLMGLMIVEEHCGLLRKMARKCLLTANIIHQKMCEIGIDARRCPYSITIYFPKVPESFRRENYIVSDDETSHFIAMPHVTEKMAVDMIERVKGMISKCDPLDLVRENGLIVRFLGD